MPPAFAGDSLESGFGDFEVAVVFVEGTKPNPPLVRRGLACLLLPSVDDAGISSLVTSSGVSVDGTADLTDESGSSLADDTCASADDTCAFADDTCDFADDTCASADGTTVFAVLAGTSMDGVAA